MDSIGKRMRIWLEHEKISTTQIQKETGISSGNISEWCNDKKLPSSKALLKLYHQYKCPVGWIITGEEQSLEESALLKAYNELSEANKLIATEEIRHLLEIQRIKKD